MGEEQASGDSLSHLPGGSSAAARQLPNAATSSLSRLTMR